MIELNWLPCNNIRASCNNVHHRCTCCRAIIINCLYQNNLHQ
jgi:hypothetical protein